LRYFRLAFAGCFVVAAWLLPEARAAESPDAARGQHVVTAVAGCTDCHGADLAGGRSFTVGTAGALVVASNLTAGPGGVGGSYSDADYVRAIRLGVRPDGTRLAVMPSWEYAVMTDADVNGVVAYLRSLPPVDRTIPHSTVSAAAAAAPGAVPPVPTTPGGYLAVLGGCFSCHGADLHGRTLRGVFAPDVSQGGIGTWSAADFTTAMRAGRTPDGRTLAAPMPWPKIGRLTDAELAALYNYLESVPARPPRTPG
jgi:mono/diheme cytochrome c family protein